MPEIVECKIMSEFINHNCNDRNFIDFSVIRDNNSIIESFNMNNFKIKSKAIGKQIIIELIFTDKIIPIYVFMGMSGNWKFVPKDKWDSIKFNRIKIDTEDGYSLLLNGGYMGPKFSIGENFKGVKRGPDPIDQFDDFKINIINNIHKKEFEKTICEVLLNQKYFNGIGSYMTSEIVGRLDINPFRSLNSFSIDEINNLFDMIIKCCSESYKHGGGELMDWENPFGYNSIKDWISFYGNNNICYKQKFGTRNIWIKKKWIYGYN